MRPLWSFKPLAEQGQAEAQFYLGLIYYMGQGISEDYAEAFKWFRKAADQGLAQAQNNLGIMYETGQGVPKDYKEAVGTLDGSVESSLWRFGRGGAAGTLQVRGHCDRNGDRSSGSRIPGR